MFALYFIESVTCAHQFLIVGDFGFRRPPSRGRQHLTTRSGGTEDAQRVKLKATFIYYNSNSMFRITFKHLNNSDRNSEGHRGLRLNIDLLEMCGSLVKMKIIMKDKTK